MSFMAMGGVNCSTQPSVDPESGAFFEYRAQRYLAGLDKTVTIVKSPSGVYAEDDSHTRWNLEDLMRWDEEKRAIKFGALSPAFFKSLAQLEPETPLPIAIYFRTPFLGDGRIQTTDEQIRQQFYADLKSDIQVRGDALRRTVDAMGVRAKLGDGLMPVLWALATPRLIEKIAHLDGVILVAPSASAPAQGQMANPSPTNAISLPRINSEFNANGHFGAGQRIGFVETAKCGVSDIHEAFTFTANGQGAGAGKPGIQYEVEPPSCNSVMDCGVCTTGGYVIPGGVQCDNIGRLPGKQCYNPHMTSTMSVVAASTPVVRWGASDAQFFVPNLGVNDQVAGSPQGIDHAYSWLVLQSVHITNESYSTDLDRFDGKSSSTDGLAQDYYSRIANVAIFRAAGNRQNHGLACPSSLNSICVGAMTQTQQLACYSNFVNLGSILGLTVGDREEPDVVAFGGGTTSQLCPAVDDILVANPTGGANDWLPRSGTSLAAPELAAMDALLTDECHPNGLNALEVRNWFRTMAFVSNPDNRWRYSTPQPVPGGQDFGDGGGALDAHVARLFCNPGGPGDPRVGHTIFDFDPRRGAGQDLPMGGGPPVGTESESGQLRLQNRGAPGAVQRVAVLVNAVHLRPGDRLRESIAWNACALQSIGTAPAQPAIDFDIFLFNRTTSTYTAASQSVDDNNEGYDHIITASDGEGDYETYIAATPGTPCGGLQREPIAYGWAQWIQL